MNILSTADLPVINGDNISLRPISDEDTELIVRWRNDPDVRRNFIYRGAFTPEIHRNWLKTKVATGQVVQYIILAGEDRHPVGSVYFRDIDQNNESAEYGVFIGEASARGKGIGSEAARLFCTFGMEVLGFHRITGRVVSGNDASIIAFRSAGYEIEGIFRDMVKLDGQFRDVVFVAKLNDEENA